VNGFSEDKCYPYDYEAGKKHTISVVWKLQSGNTILNVDIEDVIVLLPLVKLLASRTNSIDDFPYLLPLITRAIPLIGVWSSTCSSQNETYLVRLGY
jgi:hypothetical protein